MPQTEAFDARTFADAYFAMWNERRIDDAATFFVDDVRYRDIALGETLEGIEAVRRFMTGLFARFPDVRWEAIDTVQESPGKIAIQWISRRTIDGAPDEVEGVSIVHLRNGRVFDNADFRDRSSRR
jgi:predicted ester cyclase